MVSIEGHLEIWNAETYQAYMQEALAKTREAMQKMGAVRLFNKD